MEIHVYSGGSCTKREKFFMSDFIRPSVSHSKQFNVLPSEEEEVEDGG